MYTFIVTHRPKFFNQPIFTGEISGLFRSVPKKLFGIVALAVSFTGQGSSWQPNQRRQSYHATLHIYMQNAAARLVVELTTREHVTPKSTPAALAASTLARPV